MCFCAFSVQRLHRFHQIPKGSHVPKKGQEPLIERKSVFRSGTGLHSCSKEYQQAIRSLGFISLRNNTNQECCVLVMMLSGRARVP